MVKSGANKLLEGLNKEQLDAVKHKNGPLLIVAGAGTGKTTVVTRRIAWLLEQKLCKPEEVLALTFTDKAAEEMEERVDKLLPYGYMDLWISTFHAFCQRVLESHAIDIGLPVNFKLLSETEQWMLMRRNLARFELDYFRPMGNPTRFIHALLKHFSRAKDELISPQEYVDYAKNFSLDADNDLGLSGEDATLEKKKIVEAASAYSVYQKILIENNSLDFGDLITYTYELFKKRPNILARYRKQFKYILVDEFQDTNLAQYELIKQLAQPANNLTVVGDDDQSIYKFRGASVSNILKFQDDFKSSGQITLTRNYRSHQNLLDLSYKFIKQNDPDRLEKKLKISKKLQAEVAGEGIIESAVYEDYHSEAFGVLEQIVNLKKQDKKSTWSDFAILVRANEVAEVFVDILDRAGLPYIHLARRGLYRKTVIQQVLSYFQLLDNYHESRAVYRVLNLPVFSFSHDDLAQIVSYSNRKALSLFESLKQTPLVKSLSEPGQKAVFKLLSGVEKHTALARSKPVNELFVQVVRDLKIAHEESERGPETAAEVQNLSYLNQLNRKIQDFVAGSDKKLLSDFMEEVELELSSGETGQLELDTDIGPEAIKIITVHSAKGLEFKYVFLVALADKKFPVINRSESLELPERLVKDILPEGNFHIQEERRLFYVAMTRAREGVYFSYAKDYGGSSVRKPSIFLKELGFSESEAAVPTGKVELPKTIERVESKPKYPPMRWYSYSKISSFSRCSLEFFNRYVLKIPEPSKGIVSYGQTIHKVLEDYLKLYMQQNGQSQGELFTTAKKAKSSGLPPEEKLKELYKDAWVDDWYEDKFQKEKYREQGHKILHQLFLHFQKAPPKPKYIESEFKLNVGGYLFKGRIDRADTDDGGIVIIDYKTVEKKELDKNQLVVYQMAAEEFYKEKVSDLQYWFLTDTIEITHFSAKDKQVAEVKDFMIKTITQIEEAIRTGDFARFHKKHQNCRYS